MVVGFLHFGGACARKSLFCFLLHVTDLLDDATTLGLVSSDCGLGLLEFQIGIITSRYLSLHQSLEGLLVLAVQPTRVDYFIHRLQRSLDALLAMVVFFAGLNETHLAFDDDHGAAEL